MKDFRISDSDRRITELGAMSGTCVVPEETVLFVVRGMSLKSEFRVGITTRRVAFGQDCKAIIPAPGIEGKFLALALKANTPQILGMVDEAGHGTGRLPTDLISKLTIGVPPLEEQLRITEAINSIDEQVEVSLRLIAKYQEIRTAAVRSVLAAALDLFQGREAYELQRKEQRGTGSWSLIPIGSVLLGIDAGNSPDLEDTPAGPEQWGVLKVSAVGFNGFHPQENKVAHNRSLYDPSICVGEGDLLMTRANTSQLVGRSCIVDNTPPGLMLCDKTLRLRVDERNTPKRYVHIALGLPEVRRQIEIAATGTSGSMKNISQHSIKQLMIPFGRQADVQRVIEIDTLHDMQIATLSAEVDRLRLVKQGMMDDLLSGRVRVNPAAN
jgi:restriction endonuclease S subunit